MRIIEVTSRHRNDFHWKGECEHCQHVEHYGDGYADAFYCQQVVPNRHCEKCGLNSYGMTPTPVPPGEPTGKPRKEGEG